MIHDFDPSGEEHPEDCCCHCCLNDCEDYYSGIEQAEEMLRNMERYGTIDVPRGED